MLGRQRLLLVHVERRARQMARLQRLDQRVYVHRGAARGVDEDRAVLHGGEFLSAHQAAALGREAHVQADRVG